MDVGAAARLFSHQVNPMAHAFVPLGDHADQVAARAVREADERVFASALAPKPLPTGIADLAARASTPHAPPSARPRGGMQQMVQQQHGASALTTGGGMTVRQPSPEELTAALHRLRDPHGH